VNVRVIEHSATITSASNHAQTIKTSMPSVESDSTTTNVIVVPGGGPGKVSDAGFPPWTMQRTEAARSYYANSLTAEERAQSVFLLLSTGSLNAPNTRRNDGRIVFECEYMIKYLLDHGIDETQVFGDWASWDTVTNGLSLRTFLEGLSVRMESLGNKGDKTLAVHVFISDFHAARVEAAFRWILGVEPSLLGGTTRLQVHPVPTPPGMFEASAAEARKRHEEKGTEMMKSNSALIQTLPQLYSFLHTDHVGLRKYLLGKDNVSSGAGWR
jgi:hypothetical protein